MRTPGVLITAALLTLGAFLACADRPKEALEEEMTSSPSQADSEGLPLAEEAPGIPLFLTGTVVDPLGAPVPEAQVQLQAEDFPGWDSWSPVLEAEKQPVSADSLGRFRIHAEALERRHRILVWKDGFVARLLPCAPDDVDIRVELSPPIQVRGRFLMSRGTFDTDMRVTTVARGTPREKVRRIHGGQGQTLFNDGRFELKGQVVGERELWLLDRDGVIHAQALVLTMDEQQVAVPDIDLRRQVRRITLDLRSESGGKVRGGWVRDADGELLAHEVWEAPSFVTSASSLDLRVGGKKHRTVELKEVTGDVSVVLPRGIPVRMPVENVPTLEDGWELGGTLIEEGAASDEMLLLNHFLIRQEVEVATHAPATGRFGIRLFLMELDADFSVPLEIGRWQDRERLVVAEDGEPVTMVLTLSDHDVSEILDQVRKVEAQMEALVEETIEELASED